MSNSTSVAAPKRRRWLTIIGVVVVFLVLGLGVLVAFAPAIASSVAPGMVASTAGGMVQGQVKVAAASFSWGGPQKIGPIELADPAGKPVANVTIETTAGLWGLIRGSRDLGTVTIAGKADLVRNADGTTNLDKATAPRATPGAGSGSRAGTGPARLPEGLAAKVVLNSVDVTYQEIDASGQAGTTTSLKGLKGEASVGTSPAANAKVDMTGTVSDGKGSGGLKISVKLDNFADAQGLLTLDKTKVDATIESGNLPMAMLDALARLNGALREAVGPTAGISIVAKGDANAATAKISIKSENIGADLDLALRDGKLLSEKPGILSVRSTSFLRKMPAVTDGLAKAGVAITQWPAIDAKVNALALPIPKAGAGAGGADLRGIGLDVAVNATYFSGTIKPLATGAAPAGGTGAGGAGAAAAPAANPQIFAVQPTTLTITSADLATGIKVTAATTATLDKQSAGALNVDIDASELLDAQGRLSLVGGLPGKVVATVAATGVATTLLSPFVGNLPIEPGDDLGPTLDVTASARTLPRAGAAAGTGDPAADIDLSVKSANVEVAAPLRMAERALTSRGEVVVDVRKTTPMIRRVIERMPADGPSVRVGGDGAVRVVVTDLRVPMPAGAPATGAAGTTSGKPGFDLSTVAATVRTTLRGFDALPKGATGQALGVQELVASAQLTPGQATRVGVNGSMSHEGKAFAIVSDLAITGLHEALAGTGGSNAFVPGAGPMRIEGTLTASDAPMTLAKLAPAAPNAPAAPGDAGSRRNNQLVSGLLAGLVGDKVTLGLTFAAEGGESRAKSGQAVNASVRGAGLETNIGATLTATEVRVGQIDANATVRPETVRGVLQAMGSGGAGGTGGGAALNEIATRGPAKVRITAKPMTIPLLAGTLSPDLAKAGTANVDVTIAEPLIVTGIPQGDKRLTGGMRDFAATAAVPMSMFAAGGGGTGEPMRATVRGILLLDEARVVGNLAVDATVPRDMSAVDATASITGLNTAAIDGMLAQPGLVSGALGETADISLTARQELKAVAGGAASPMRAKVQISKSPRLNTEPLDVMMDSQRIALLAPAKATWTLDPAWADRFVLAPAPGKTQTFRLLGPTNLAVDIRKLSIAQREVRGGLVVTDALKPGIFAIDLSATAQKVQIQPIDAAGAGTPVTLDGVVADVRTAADQSLSIDIRAASVSGGSVASRDPVTLKAAVRELATSGGTFNREGYSADIDLRAPSVPTALLDAVAGMNGRLVDLLGPQVRATLDAKNFSPRQGSSGNLALDVRSFRPPTAEPAALATLSAPVRDGLIETPAATPLRLELAEFNVGERDKLVQTLGIIASMSKTRLDAQGKPNPAVIQSGNLRIPLDPNRGNLRRLSGDIDVSLGAVNYTLRTGLSSLIQTGAVKEYLSRDVKQPAMKPFRVVIREGVATYDNVELPLKVGIGLGEEIVTVPLSGRVDLVDQTIDGQVVLPLELVSGTVLSVLPVGWSDLRGKMLGTLGDKNADPKQQEKAKSARKIGVPIRISGPLDNPKFDVNLNLFNSSNKGFDPRSAFEDIADTIKGIGDLFKKPGK